MTDEDLDTFLASMRIGSRSGAPRSKRGKPTSGRFWAAIDAGRPAAAYACSSRSSKHQRWNVRGEVFQG
jgi:hypothetical protein